MHMWKWLSADLRINTEKKNSTGWIDNEGKSMRLVTRAQVQKGRPNQRVKKAIVISPNQEQPSLPMVSSSITHRTVYSSDD